MKLVHERPSSLINRFSSQTSPLGITTLDNEICDDTMENGVVVVALHTELNKVPAGFWGLLGPELY
jgi:hypothetical protein